MQTPSQPAPQQQAPVQPNPEPTSVPAVQAGTPPIRTCAEIRASGSYNSDAERTFFLTNCAATPQAAAPSSPNQNPAPAAPSAPEGCFVTAPIFDNTILPNQSASIAARFTCNGSPVAGVPMLFTVYSDLGTRSSCSASTSSTGFGSCSAVIPRANRSILMEVCISWQGTVYCNDEVFTRN